MARSLEFKILVRLLQLHSEESPGGISPGRRDFLKKAAVGGAASAAAMAFSACSTFDRWVMGDSQHLEEEVMVLGAGIAGLSAAYHLKKSRAPYRIYEASDRVGGRVQTLFHTNADQQFVELGAEFFEASHQKTHQLCKDLNLTVQDISYDPKGERNLYWLNGKVVHEKEFRKNLKPLALKLAQVRRDLFSALGPEITPRFLLSHPFAAALDRQSLGDFLNLLRDSVDSATLESFEKLCVSEWGVESANINLLHFLVRLDSEEKNARALPTPKLYRVQGGMARMAQVLGERTQGIVPNSTLKLGHQLVALRARSGGYECTFKRPGGSETVWARQVICTLPWSILKDIDGIQSLELGLKKDLITRATYATHAKVISSFQAPEWKKKVKGSASFQGGFRGQLKGQSYWDSSRGQGGSAGLLTSQRGGSAGLSTGLEAPQETLQDLRHFYKEVAPEEASYVCNWSQKPFAKGSRHNLPPGNYLKFVEALQEETDKEKFYLAGEHMSFEFPGTLNGAIESGVAAAEKALQSVSKRI